MPDISLPEFEFSTHDDDVTSALQGSINEPVQEEDKPTQEAVEPPQEEGYAYEEGGTEEPDEAEDSAEEQESDVETDPRYASLAEFYREEGLLNFEGEFAGGADEFAQILKAQREADAQQAALNLIGAAPEYAQTLMEYILSNGDRLTKHDLVEFFDMVDAEDKVPSDFDEDTAEVFLIERYTETLKSKDKARKYVDMLKFDGELIDTASKEAEEERGKIKEMQQQKVQASKEQDILKQRQAAAYQQELLKKAGELPWSPAAKQQAVEFIYNQGLQQATQDIVNHPAALLKLANYLRHFNPETGDIDEEAYRKQAFSKAAKQLKNTIESRFLRSDAMASGRVEQKRRDDKNVQFEFAD